MQHAINVNAKYDPVSSLDEPRGSVFIIRCPHGFANCHSMTYVVCELWRSCENDYPAFCENILPKEDFYRDPDVKMDLKALSLTIRYITKFFGLLVILFVNFKEESEETSKEWKKLQENMRNREKRVVEAEPEDEVKMSDTSKAVGAILSAQNAKKRKSLTKSKDSNIH